MRYDMSPGVKLRKFRGLVAELIESGVYPSIGALNHVGYGRVCGYSPQLPSGRYTTAKNEVLTNYGYVVGSGSARRNGQRYVAPLGRP